MRLAGAAASTPASRAIPIKALQRVRREWWDPERELVPGNIVWIDNTPAGDEIARAIEAARDS